jgi:cytochrome c oxidase subunit 3
MSEVEVQFQDREQQKLTSSQGMWIFLATESLFFGVLFLGYTMLRLNYSDDFKIVSHEMSLTFGTVNMVVLMTSSLFMALAVRAAQAGKTLKLFFLLLVTAILGTAFLTIKGFEYAYDIRHHSVPGPSMEIQGHSDRPAFHLFLFFYWVMTGFHALHLTIGIGLVGYLLIWTMIGKFSKEYHNPVEVVGLYWHFVDIVWLFLYPALYLDGAGLK